MTDRFLSSREWKNLRAKFLETAEPYCDECNRGPLSGKSLQVDHILPRSTHPDLAKSISNLRVLCGPPAGDCNQRKGSKSLFRTNWFNDQWIRAEAMNPTRFSPKQ